MASSARRHLTVALLAIAAAGCGEGSALAPASPQARSIADLSWVLVAAGVTVYVLVMAALAVPLWRSRRHRMAGTADPEVDPQADVDTRQRLVLVGGVVAPAVVVVAVVTLGATVGRGVAPTAPEDALVVDVVGHQFWWEVEYPDLEVVTANEIHVPVGRPVHLRLHSADVIHSFWVPPLHGKIDLRPGAQTSLSFEADRSGTFVGRCAEYCGLAHAQMEVRVVAQEAADFEAWAQQVARPAEPPTTDTAARGQEVFGASCAACHDVRGHFDADEDRFAGATAGPDLTHLASRTTLAAGILRNERDRLEAWVRDPHRAKPGVAMPASDLDEDDLAAVLDYLEGLR